MSGNVGECKACHAAIRWVTTVNKKPMPLEAESTTTGDPTVVLYSLDGERLTAEPGEQRTGYVPHFAMCPGRWP